METLTEKFKRFENAEAKKHGVLKWRMMDEKKRNCAILRRWRKEKMAERMQRDVRDILQSVGALVLIGSLIAATQITPQEPEMVQETEAQEQTYVVQALSAESIKERPWNIIESATVYHYCACEKCCGKAVDNPAYGVTRSGTAATAGRTIAVDPDVIPLGAEVVIDGKTYIAEDTGGAIKGYTVDIYCESHAEAVEKGVYQTEIKWRKGVKQ